MSACVVKHVGAIAVQIRCDELAGEVREGSHKRQDRKVLEGVSGSTWTL